MPNVWPDAVLSTGSAVALPYFAGSRAGHQLMAMAYEIATQLRDARDQLRNLGR